MPCLKGVAPFLLPVFRARQAAVHHVSAVHDQHRTGHISRIIRGKEGHAPGDPFRLGDFLKRDPLEQGLLDGVGVHWSGQFGVGSAGLDAIDVYLVRGKLRCNGFTEGLHSPFAGSVDSTRRLRYRGVNRGNVDDLAAGALGDHLPGGRLATQEAALEIVADHPVPIVLLGVDQRGLVYDRGVIHQYIDLAKGLESLFDDPFPDYDTEPVMAYANDPDFAA